MTEYPYVRAAFINAIAEEGTKEEAVSYLQKQWNENCALRAEIERLTKAHDTVCGALAEAIKRAEKAETALEAYGREKVREVMKRAAEVARECWNDPLCEADAEYIPNAILAEMEKEGGE